jgi:hypothetical protein
LDYLWRVGSGEWNSPPPAPGLEGQGDQGFNPESLEPDPESEPMSLHRSTPSVAEAAGPVPAAVRIRRVENVRHAHQCLHAADWRATIAVGNFRVEPVSWFHIRLCTDRPGHLVMTNHDIHVLFRDFWLQCEDHSRRSSLAR